MSLSTTERDRRHGELKKRMKEKGVSLLVVFGDTGDFGLRYGNLRYLTNGKVIFWNAVLVFPIHQEPVLLMTSNLQAGWSRKLSWIADVRVSSNLISDVVKTVASLGAREKRLGVASLASIPLSWYQTLRQEFPSMDLVEMAPVIEAMRYLKGEEEVELARRAAYLCDKGFQNRLSGLKPGMTEFEALALLERPMREGGGDDFFNLVFSGPFEKGVTMSPYSPTGRREPSRSIQTGDSLLFEITVRYGGYWAQLVRVLSVGGQNRLLAQYQGLARRGIEAGVQRFKPGIKLGDAILEVKNVYEAGGVKLDLPIGHICGLDLVESRINLESDVLQQGMIIIFHPPVTSRETRLFVGETYVITAHGCERLHQTPNEAFVV
jgi:Xaa-Pro aminopeptidase